MSSQSAWLLAQLVLLPLSALGASWLSRHLGTSRLTFWPRSPFALSRPLSVSSSSPATPNGTILHPPHLPTQAVVGKAIIQLDAR